MRLLSLLKKTSQMTLDPLRGGKLSVSFTSAGLSRQCECAGSPLLPYLERNIHFHTGNVHAVGLKMVMSFALNLKETS